ncbi:odorant receptor 30a-like [Maniola hyperantus]|uniref:odorant receptor 30a-like n=1 Tax=Aphantopus hyperantus TaxID=2795564 RepID=UPI0037490980
MFWLVFFRYTIPENFIAMTVAISLTTCSVTSVTKILFMKYNVNHIQEIVENFLTFDAQIVQKTRFAINLRKNLRLVKKRALFIWVFLLSNCAIYMMIPFLRPGRHFTQDLYIIYGLEPMVESPNYEIASTLTTIGITYGVCVMVNVAVYVIVILGYNEAQFYAISEELKNLWDDSQNFYKKIKHQIQYNKIYAINIREKIVNEYIRIRLKTLIHYHVTNVNLFKEMSCQLSDILAIEYSIMVIAIIAELLGGLENTYLQVPYTLVQISMDCLSGQRLIDACHELENSLYSCEWENFNVSNQKTILLMLLISQKTLMLSAGGMTNLNFSCLMIILKSSYSAYTTLKSSIQN